MITEIVLGSQWAEASGFIGLWGLTSSLTIILSHYSSEVYRAKGQPKLSVLAQWLHIIVLWPTLLIAINYGFEVLYTARALVRIELIAVNLIIMYCIMKISPWQMIKNISTSIISVLIMAIVAFFLLRINNSLNWQFVYIVICGVIYFSILLLFPNERKIIFNIKNILKQR